MKMKVIGFCLVLVIATSVVLAHAPASAVVPTNTACGIESDCLGQAVTKGYADLGAITATDFVYVPSPTPSATVRQTAVSYVVETRGAIRTNLTEFKVQANETLNSNLGWARLGVTFTEVASGGDFTLVLSEAGQVPSFSPSVCSADYSCNIDRYVIINQDRWLGATAPWNANGGSLRDYRHMVINHETGHWLGHPHEFCSGAGNKAAVMQQQSISLQTCKFNPWPLDSELWAPRLGI